MNMEIWNKLKQPPQSALKTIMGGRLKGKTDINPQYRYRAMTEQFGVCGVGWKYEVEQVWNEEASEGQRFAFAKIQLYFKDGDKWSDPIPGVGGSMLVEKESSGLHASDEGYKMAITDALSVAMKMIGVGADIYEGLWDGTKYNSGPDKQASTPSSAPEATTDKPHWCKEHNTAFFKSAKMKSYAHPIKDTKEWCNEPAPEATKSTPEPPKPKTDSPVLKPVETMQDYCKKLGWGKVAWQEYLRIKYNTTKLGDLTDEQVITAAADLKAMVMVKEAGGEAEVVE